MTVDQLLRETPVSLAENGRALTVGYATGLGRGDIPCIKFQGNWLLQLGFAVGDIVELIAEEPGRLMLTKRPGPAASAPVQPHLL